MSLFSRLSRESAAGSASAVVDTLEEVEGLDAEMAWVPDDGGGAEDPHAHSSALEKKAAPA